MNKRPAHSPVRWDTQSGSEADDDERDDDYEPDVVVTVVQPSRQHWDAPGTIVASSPIRSTHSSSFRKMSLANFLPHEILVHIFKKLTSKEDHYSALLVSRAWCQCSVELLWHKLSVNKLATLLQIMHIISRKDQTFAYATFIRRVNLTTHSKGMTDEQFIRVAPCIKLERLTLGNCQQLTDTSLNVVFAACPNLIAVDLNAVYNVTDKSIITLAKTTNKLQGINLNKCKLVTDAGVSAIAENAPLLRRIKLSGLTLLTDESISSLALKCPLLLEMDLTNCTTLTDACIRDIWMNQRHLRELQLSGITSLTDDAFPSPPLVPFTSASRAALSRSGTSANLPVEERTPDRLPAFYLSEAFDTLRVLDVTCCSLLTDAAVEGIVTNCPKLRQVTMTRCSGLSDEALVSLGKLGKNLHFIHLGHVQQLTDRGVTTLAQACPRIRYIDLANCTNLTDLAVFEIASLTKLRRVGLVRLPNLTDNAVYALSEKPTAGLERIHLSYCDNISIGAINFLLQRLQKLTHLSLTGIAQFRRKDLRQFCRPPPQEFNQHQRLAFCVYSGRGVGELRKFLHNLALRDRDALVQENIRDMAHLIATLDPQRGPQRAANRGRLGTHALAPAAEIINAPEVDEVGDELDEDLGGEDVDGDGDGHIDLDAADDDAIVWPAPPNGHRSNRADANLVQNQNRRAGRSHHHPASGGNTPPRSSHRSHRHNANHSTPSLNSTAGASTSSSSTARPNVPNIHGVTRVPGHRNGSVSSTSTVRPAEQLAHQSQSRQHRPSSIQPPPAPFPQTRLPETGTSTPSSTRSSRNHHNHRHGNRVRNLNGQDRHSPSGSPTGSGSGSHDSEGDVVYPAVGPSTSNSGSTIGPSNQARHGRRPSGGRSGHAGGAGSSSLPPRSPIVEDQSDTGAIRTNNPRGAGIPGLSSYMQSILPVQTSTRLRELVFNSGEGATRSSEDSDTPVYGYYATNRSPNTVSRPAHPSQQPSPARPNPHREAARAAGEAAIARFEAAWNGDVPRRSVDRTNSGDSNSSYVVVDETDGGAEATLIAALGGNGGNDGRNGRDRGRQSGNVTPAASEPTTEGSVSDDAILIGEHGRINPDYVHVEDALMASGSRRGLGSGSHSRSDTNLGSSTAGGGSSSSPGGAGGRGRTTARLGVDGATAAANSSPSSPARRAGFQQQITSLFRRGGVSGGD